MLNKAEQFDTFELTTDGLLTNDSGPLVINVTIDNRGVIRATNSNIAHAITFNEPPAAGSIGRFELDVSANARMVFAEGSGVEWTSETTGPYFDIVKGNLTIEDVVTEDAGLRMINGSLTVTGVTPPEIEHRFFACEAWVDPP